MNDNHAKFHSKNAFCGYAGPEEMQHLRDLIAELTDRELKQLVKKVKISFICDERELDREAYENVVEEADREDFYREYKKIIRARPKHKVLK